MVLLLGNRESSSSKGWQVLHHTETYRDMAREMDIHIDRSYNAFSVVSDRYFDPQSGTITDPERAFAETPSFVEDAFVQSWYPSDYLENEVEHAPNL